jgi:hypothetical protein
MQCFMVEMLAKFRFTHVVDPKLIGREATAVMSPIVKGEEHKGAQLPLRITRLTASE